MNANNKKVMIVGGGIAGMTAARELAKSGVSVTLVEKAGFLGGHAIRYACKATDECLKCGACPVEAVMKTVVNDPLISVSLNTEIESVSMNGKYSISLKKCDNPIAEAAGDNACDSYEKCASAVALGKGYSKNNDKFFDAPGKVNAAYEGKAETVEVDAVILATGFTAFNPALKPTYNYGKFPNVISGLDLERGKRIHGTAIKPSDGTVPQSIAFIQCVGSRDERLGNLWCSKVCCPYALRTALSMKHSNPDLAITFFYMDIQNTGRDFKGFFDKCKENFRFVRAIPVDTYETKDGKIKTRYTNEEDGQPVEENFDMIVLSHGIMPGADNVSLSEKFGISRDQDGFFQGAGVLNSTLTEKQGLFLAGTIEGPKNIASSMAHAGQAAMETIKYLGGAR